MESLVLGSLATHSRVMLCYWTTNNFFNSGLKFAVCGATSQNEAAYGVPEASSDLSLVDSYCCNFSRPDLFTIYESNIDMTSIRLDALPKELIAHVACCSDASSVIRLSSTCKAIRAACYDSLVFKHIILASQQHFWTDGNLDIDAIADQAGNDAATWARYAVADKIASDHSNSESPLESPQRFVNCLPELFVVKHPFMHAPCWQRSLIKPPDQKANQVFCLAMAILASEQDMPQAFKSLYKTDVRDDNVKSFLLALSAMALTLRSGLRIRLAAWPYNNAAIVPHISFPKAGQIPLRPLNDSYGLPLPFSRKAVELLGRSTTSFGGWDSWYHQHNAAFARSLMEGEWCGYYVRYGVSSIDPPMTETHFRTKDGSTLDEWNPTENPFVEIEALNCIDGIDKFDLSGTLSFRGREIGFVAQKEYQNSSTRWDWDCRLTPFGIVGYWGHRRSEDARLSRYGIVWLWKKEWTDVVG